MRHELRSLLEGCRWEPGDDAARLVVADWLEEHGDEGDRDRAAFVRLEATSGEHLGRPGFARTRAAWLDRWRTAWFPFQEALRPGARAESDRGLIRATADAAAMGSLDAEFIADREEWAWVGRVSVMAWEGGLRHALDSPLLTPGLTLEVSGAALEAFDSHALGSSPRVARLRGLTLRGVPRATLAPLFRSPHAAGLRSLRVGQAWLVGLDAEALPALEELEVRGEDAVVAAAGRRLRSLDVHGPSQQVVRELAAVCGGLRRLGMSGWHAVDGEALAGGAFWPTLEALSLRHGEMSPAGAAALAGVEAPRLRALRCPIGRDGAAALRALARGGLLAGLSHLDLAGDRFGAGGVAALATATACPLALDLSGCQIGDGGMAALARWPGFARCRVLNVANNVVNAAGAAALAASSHAGGLTGLDLGGNPIGGDGLERLLSADWIGGLESLRIEETMFGGRGARALLRAAPRLPRLKELIVGGRQITDAVRAAFAHVPCVE